MINNIPVRVQVDPQLPLLPWLKDFQAQQNELLNYENTPLPLIQQWSELHASRPLFESLLLFQNWPDVHVFSQLHNLQFHPLVRTMYPLTLFVLPKGNSLLVNLAYERSRISATAPRLMLVHFLSLIESVISQPDGSLRPLLESVPELKLFEIVPATRPRGEESHGRFVAPRTETERTIAEICRSVLDLERIGIHDDFFQLGGHSLFAVEILARLSASYQITLALRDLFENPTVAGLAAAVTQHDDESTSYEALPAVVPDLAARYQPFPLTDTQQAYWIGRSGLFELGDVATHSYFELDGVDLDIQRLNDAWQRLVERHEMLRAVVLADGQQQILPDVPYYKIEVSDLMDLTPVAASNHLDTIRQELSHHVLPSDQWPLFEIRAARLAEQRVRIFVSFDALIVDAWSFQVIFKEWSQLYREPETQLPPLELSFRDYVLAETALENSEAFRRSMEYWETRVTTLPPAPELPLTQQPASLATTRFTRRTTVLPSEVWSELKTKAADKGLTPPGLLLAAYAAVLALWSKSPRFTISVPRFNRLPLHPQVNSLVGEFASFNLLEIDFSVQESFESRAHGIQQQLWSDLDHSSFGGVKVLRKLAQAQEESVGAIMPVVFTSAPQDTRDKDASVLSSMKGLGKLVYSINQSSQVWLDNHVSEHDGTLICDWDSVDDLFPGELSSEMLDTYFRLLRYLAADEAGWDSSCPELLHWLMPPEQVSHRSKLNATDKAVPEKLLQDLFVEQADRRPTQLAVTSSARNLTYRELNVLSNRWGRRLRQLGAKPNSLVAVVMEKGWEQIVAVLGILQSGAAYLPIDPELPQERLWYLLEHSEAQLILTQSPLDEKLSWPANVQRFCVDRDDLAEMSSEPLEPAQHSDDLAYVIYTSGSTGLPKGVMIAHRGLINSILHTNESFRVRPEDRALAVTALHHDMSVYDIFGLLAAGGTLVMPDAARRRDPAHWVELMVSERVTIWNSVPAMMEMLLEYVREEPNVLPQSLRLAFLGGDWIPVTVPTRLRSLVKDVEVVSVGGPTETTLWNIWYPVKAVDPAWKSIPYGRPIANTKYYVLNDALESCPTWVTGEMCCAGVGLAKGYWRDEERTRAKFLVHPRSGETLYRTGDLGRYLPDGNLEFIGRSDFQVKIQGQRIELGEIEAAIRKHVSVNAAVVTAVGEAQGKKRLIAYVVPEEGVSLNGDLREFLLGKLPEHMVPSLYVMLERLPLTPNGKVNRKALPEPPQVNQGASPGTKTCDAGVSTRISALIGRVLEIGELDSAVNLLSYGANSIDMVRIGNQLEKEFGFRPRMDQLFRLQTIDALAKYYDDHLQQNQMPAETVHQSSESSIDAIVSSYRVMIDPAERDAFKEAQPGLRRGLEAKKFIQLQTPEVDEGLRKQYEDRRSYRRFSLRPIPFEKFSKFLSCLYQIKLDAKPKYLYASPGGLYPTQTYFHFKPGRVEGVDAGVYYYQPVENRLIALANSDLIDRDIHIPFINTPIFDEAAFSIFLIAQLSAIAPAYGERSLHFATLEAGVISHLLETNAPEYGIGLCQIGSVDFERIQQLFELDKSQVLIHSLLGGAINNNGTANSNSVDANLSHRADPVGNIMDRIKQLSQEEVKALLDASRD